MITRKYPTASPNRLSSAVGINNRSIGLAKVIHTIMIKIVATALIKVDCSILSAASWFSLAPICLATIILVPVVTMEKNAETTVIIVLAIPIAASALELIVLMICEIASPINMVKLFSIITGRTNLTVKLSSRFLSLGNRSIALSFFRNI